MENLGLGQFNDIDEFVADKLKKLDAAEPGFSSLFELMFSERDNLMYEKSEGYRIKKSTYGEVYSDILGYAGTLRGFGFEKNAVIGLSMDNSLLWIELFWAILAAGLRPLLINLRLSQDTVEQALKDCGAQAVISDGRSYDIKTINADEIAKGEAKTIASGFGSELLVMSSGTSEHVKICAYSAEEFRSQIHDSAEIINECELIKKHYDGYLKQLTFLPFYHVFGLIAVYIWFAFFSRAFVQLNDLAPQTITNTIKRHKVTHIFAVPLFWETVYDQAIKTIKKRGEKTYAKFQKGMRIYRRLSGIPSLAKKFSALAFKEVRQNLFGDSICFMITGGSAIRPEVMEFFNAIGYHLADGYGMSEIGITSVELSENPRVLNGGSVGKPMSCAEYKINENGELLVRGNGIAKYIFEDGKKRVNDKAEWFNTHDLAELRDGNYYILGRSDDLIVAANGENLNPNLTEPRLNIEGANGVCLISDNGVPTLLVSVNRFTSKEQLERLDVSIKDRIKALNLGGQIGKIAYVGEPLLKGDEFKLNRKRIAREFSSGSMPRLDPKAMKSGGTDDEVMTYLKELCAAALEKDVADISPEADFFADMGGNSLDYFAMLSQIGEDFGVSVPQNLATLSEIHQFIRNGQNNAD